MATSRRSKITPFEPWETKHADGVEKRYFRLGASIMASVPFVFIVICVLNQQEREVSSFLIRSIKVL